MSGKTKGYLWMLITSLSFYMCLDTRYSPALGDSVLNFLGLKAWSGGDKGLHITLIYFGIIILYGYFSMTKYWIIPYKVQRKKILTIFIVLVMLIHFIFIGLLIGIKSNSNELLSIGMLRGNTGKYSIRYKDNEIQKFEIEFELINYSSETQKFGIEFTRYNSDDNITVYDSNGELAIFELGGKESRKFNIDLEDYLLSGSDIEAGGTGSFSGSIDNIFLIDEEKDVVKIGKDDFLGELITID